MWFAKLSYKHLFEMLLFQLYQCVTIGEVVVMSTSSCISQDQSSGYCFENLGMPQIITNITNMNGEKWKCVAYNIMWEQRAINDISFIFLGLWDEECFQIFFLFLEIYIVFKLCFSIRLYQVLLESPWELHLKITKLTTNPSYLFLSSNASFLHKYSEMAQEVKLFCWWKSPLKSSFCAGIRTILRKSY